MPRELKYDPLLVLKHELKLAYDTTNRILMEGNGYYLRQLINMFVNRIEKKILREILTILYT